MYCWVQPDLPRLDGGGPRKPAKACDRLAAPTRAPIRGLVREGTLRGLAGEPVNVRTTWGGGGGDAFYVKPRRQRGHPPESNEGMSPQQRALRFYTTS